MGSRVLIEGYFDKEGLAMAHGISVFARSFEPKPG